MKIYIKNTNGYQPKKGTLDRTKPPQQGSGIK